MRRVSPSGNAAVLSSALLALTAVTTLALAVPRAATACMMVPPPPFCGKTLVLAKAAPPVVVLPGGGTFNVPVAVVFNLVDFPAGSGICPAGPYSVTVSLTATCSVAGGSGMITVPIAPGINQLTVPVTVGAGPPRICTVAGTATTTLADGMTLTAMGDSQVCIVEPSPTNPSEPRLDFELLTGDDISRVHPGDQAVNIYRLLNNDLDESFTGEITVEMTNSSRLPTATGPTLPGTGPFSISDPFEGDNFPVAFDSGLVDGCVPLFADPTDPSPSTASQPVTVAPGTFVDIPIYSRPWGMCADGSCGEAKVTVDGDFSDATPGFACSGFVTIADRSQPPTYLWPDAGQVVTFTPLDFFTLSATAEPSPGDAVDVALFTADVQAEIDGAPPGDPPQTFTGNIKDDLGRTQIQITDPGGFEVGAFYDITISVQVEVDPLVFEPELVEMELVGGSPTNFEQLAPSGLGKVEIDRLSTPQPVDAFFQVIYQVSGVAIDDVGERTELVFDIIDFSPLMDGSGFQALLAGTVPPPPQPTAQVLALELAQDFRGFMSVGDPDALIFADGFESGDIAAWSLQRP